MAFMPGQISQDSDEESKRPFPYQPLDTSLCQVRLFKLSRRTTENGSLQGIFKHTTLGKDHICLSYMWGSANTTKPIIVNGEPFKVPDHLNEFLQFAVEQFASEWLWIDALCINQGNVRERNHQVAMMGQIYSRAKKVIVYAGSGNADIERALQAADALMPSPQLERSLHKLHATDFDLAVFQGLWTVHAKGLAALCQLPYWDRAWIKQEIMLAKDLVFVYGKTYYHWQMIVNIMSGATQQDDKSDAIAVVLSTAPDNRSLIAHLARFKHLKCTDPRDRIFSLLGISIDASSFPLDYSASLWQLFVRMVVLQCRDLVRISQRLMEPEIQREVPLTVARYVCKVFSKCLFEVEYLDLDLAEALQVASSVEFVDCSTHLHTPARIRSFQVSCQNHLRYFTGAHGSESALGSGVEEHGSAKGLFESLDMVLIHADTESGPFMSYFALLSPKRIHMLCRCSPAEQSHRLLWIASADPVEDAESSKATFSAKGAAWHPIKSTVIVSFKPLEITSVQDGDFHTDVYHDAAWAEVTLHLDLTGLLELAQILDRLGSKRTRELTPDVQQRECYPGDTRIFGRPT